MHAGTSDALLTCMMILFEIGIWFGLGIDVGRARAGELATLTVTVDQHLVPPSPRQPYRVWCRDQPGRLSITYFNLWRGRIWQVTVLGGASAIVGGLLY